MSNKIFKNYLPELFSNLFGRKRPTTVSLNITDICNQKCIYCEIGQSIESNKKCRLSVEDIKWIIDEMDKENIPRISINGGEPFLFNRIFEIVTYAGEKKIQCAITTNGMNFHSLSEDKIGILKKYNSEINVSIDSFNVEIQTQTRGCDDALENAIKTIKKLKQNGFIVTVLSAISRYNFQDLFSSMKTALDFNVDQILYQPIIYYSNYPDRKTIENKAAINVNGSDIDVLLQELLFIYKYEKRHKVKTNVYRILPWIESYLLTASGKGEKWFFQKTLRRFQCREIHAIIDITYDGGIQPCALAPSKINIITNKKGGLLKLWQEATVSIKSDLDNERYRPYCNGCCNHFSRNMLASIMMYPFANRTILIKMSSLLLKRFFNITYKKIFIR